MNEIEQFIHDKILPQWPDVAAQLEETSAADKIKLLKKHSHRIFHLTNVPDKVKARWNNWTCPTLDWHWERVLARPKVTKIADRYAVVKTAPAHMLTTLIEKGVMPDALVCHPNLTDEHMQLYGRKVEFQYAWNDINPVAYPYIKCPQSAWTFDHAPAKLKKLWFEVGSEGLSNLIPQLTNLGGVPVNENTYKALLRNPHIKLTHIKQIQAQFGLPGNWDFDLLRHYAESIRTFIYNHTTCDKTKCRIDFLRGWKKRDFTDFLTKWEGLKAVSTTPLAECLLGTYGPAHKDRELKWVSMEMWAWLHRGIRGNNTLRTRISEKIDVFDILGA